MATISSLPDKDHPSRMEVADLLQELSDKARTTENLSGCFVILIHANGTWREDYTGEIHISTLLGFMERSKASMIHKLDVEDAK